MQIIKDFTKYIKIINQMERVFSLYIVVVFRMWSNNNLNAKWIRRSILYIFKSRPIFKNKKNDKQWISETNLYIMYAYNYVPTYVWMHLYLYVYLLMYINYACIVYTCNTQFCGQLFLITLDQDRPAECIIYTCI